MYGVGVSPTAPATSPRAAIVLNLSYELAAGEQITVERMKEIIGRADAKKEQLKGKPRLEVTAMANGEWYESRPKGWPKHGFEKRLGVIAFAVLIVFVFSAWRFMGRRKQADSEGCNGFTFRITS